MNIMSTKFCNKCTKASTTINCFISYKQEKIDGSEKQDSTSKNVRQDKSLSEIMLQLMNDFKSYVLLFVTFVKRASSINDCTALMCVTIKMYQILCVIMIDLQ